MYVTEYNRLAHNWDIKFYKLKPVLYAFTTFIDDKLRHNIVKVAVEPGAAGEWFRSKL